MAVESDIPRCWRASGAHDGHADFHLRPVRHLSATYDVRAVSPPPIPANYILLTLRRWFRTLFGQWLVTTVICGASYALAWPLETLKNLAQASLPTPGASVAQRIAFLGGWRGLYAGSAPGILCGSFRNGVAMLTMAKYHAFATRIGLRETSKPVERRLDS